MLEILMNEIIFIIGIKTIFKNQSKIISALGFKIICLEETEDDPKSLQQDNPIYCSFKIEPAYVCIIYMN